MTNFAPTFILSIFLLLVSCSATAIGDHVDVYTSENHYTWCVASSSASREALQSNIDFACSKVDCGPIQPGGSCYLPDILSSHASFAMNSYYQKFGKTLEACAFGNTGVITTNDPSHGDCHYE